MTWSALAGPTGPPAAEPDLIARVRQGERAAEHDLFARHVQRVHRLIHRLCGDGDLAEDLTQETFVKAFAELHRFRGESSFPTWLHRIAVNLTLNAERGSRRRARWLVPLTGNEAVAAPAAMEADVATALEGAVARLSAGHRTVFVMFALEGYSHLEIGEVLGISEGTSKSRLFHARARLREWLAHMAPEKQE